jgi:hypothetical protein
MNTTMGRTSACGPLIMLATIGMLHMLITLLMMPRQIEIPIATRRAAKVIIALPRWRR